MADLKEQLAKDYGKVGSQHSQPKPGQLVATKPNGESPAKKRKPPVRKIYTAIERAELQQANLGRSGAIAARRIMGLLKQAKTAKLDNDKVTAPLQTALLVASRIGKFADKYEKTGIAIVKFLNRNSEQTGLRFGIAADRSIKCGKVQIQFED